MSEPRLLDVTGRLRSPAATPGHSAGCAPPNKGQHYPADPPTVEEIILAMRQAGPGPYADRTRALIPILWRAGLRISEALALTESDLDPKTGSVLIRQGRGGKRKTVGMNDWAWEHVTGWTEHRIQLPIGPLFCLLAEPTTVAAGPRPLPVVSFAGSPLRLGCGGASRRTSSGTLTRSRWRTKGSRCRLSRGSSTRQSRRHQHIPGRDRQERDHRHRPSPAISRDPRERGPTPIVGPDGGAWSAHQRPAALGAVVAEARSSHAAGPAHVIHRVRKERRGRPVSAARHGCIAPRAAA